MCINKPQIRKVCIKFIIFELFFLLFINSGTANNDIEKVDCSSPIKLMLSTRRFLKFDDFKARWSFHSKLAKETFGNKFENYEKWNISQRKLMPRLTEIYWRAPLKKVKYITKNRAFVEFSEYNYDIQKDDPFSRGCYLIKENGRWLYGDLCRTIQIKVAKDFECIKQAIEKYFFDNRILPKNLANLISPVSYIANIPKDPFNDQNGDYKYIIINDADYKYILYSFGPDSDDDFGTILYDPSNGAISNGDIIIQGAV